MKEKPIFRLVVTMSLPMVISMMVNSLYNIIDSFFVAKISENAMTALSLVFPLQNLVTAVTVGFGIGINAVIAYHLGADEQKKADEAATKGLLLNTLHGVFLTIFCISIMPAFLRMFSSDTDTINLGLRYSNIVFAFSIIIALEVSFEKIFQSVGKMTVSMISMMLGCITNIILDPILIFGLGPFPKLGIEGAAIATGISQVLTLIIYLAFFILRPIPVHISLKALKSVVKTSRNNTDQTQTFESAGKHSIQTQSAQTNIVARLYAVGIPAALNMALPSLMISALNGILAVYSQTYVLVLGAYYKLQTFLYLSANGIVQGIRPLVGYNYGAKEYKRVNKIYTTALLLALGIMAVGTILCLMIPSQLIGLFTDQAETIQIGAHALRIIGAGFIVSAVSVVSAGALEGLGMGKSSLIITLFRYLLFIVPIAWILSHWIGATGVWHAFWITEIGTAAIAYKIYRKATKDFSS